VGNVVDDEQPDSAGATNQSVNITLPGAYLKDVAAPTITGALTTGGVEGCAPAAAAATTVAELEALPGNLAVSDNCTSNNALAVSHTDANAGACPIVLTRTYTITDAAGNAATLTHTLNIDDMTASRRWRRACNSATCYNWTTKRCRARPTIRTCRR
jgi:hypothetical protein